MDQLSPGRGLEVVPHRQGRELDRFLFGELVLAGQLATAARFVFPRTAEPDASDRAAVEQGKRVSVLADETRPRWQGARLTAWELMQDGIPVTLIVDGVAGYFVNRGEVNLVLVGADRVAANGDTANKIGTYSLSVLARENGVPFYVVSPVSTIDLSIASGEDIPIEERDASEVVQVGGISLAPEGVTVANPAFDVTPHRYVTGIVTENGVAYPPFDLSLEHVA